MAKRKQQPQQNDPSGLLSLDIGFRDRQLAAQTAEAAAQQAYQRMRLQLVEVPGLDVQKDEIAKDYAMKQAGLEFQKAQAERQFGLDERGQAFQEEIGRRKASLDEWMGQQTVALQQGQLTLDNLKVQIQSSQFDRQIAENSRQFNAEFGENQRQFNATNALDQAKTVLNAPRGIADYAAFLNRMRGVQAQGGLPGALQSFSQGGTVAPLSNAGQPTGPIASNTDLAMSTVYGQQRLPSSYDQTSGTAPQGGQQGGMALPLGFGGNTGDNYSFKRGDQYSLQNWNNLNSDEQEYALGAVEDDPSNPQTARSFMEGMQRAAPTYQRARQARYSGIY